MKHYGDICRMKGAEVERVECVIGGSPCQDLSVAGKRAGLAGERSGLFMEQIRIIKEMRARDRSEGRTDTDVFPRFMVWENVVGTFSSNGGEDFQAVLEETARVSEPGISIPGYEGGRWKNAGAIIGTGWSICWRTHDAQFWGVPQRRRRISLVADFNGVLAPEILFERDSGNESGSEVQSERESMPGHSEPGREEGEGTSGKAERGTGTTGSAMNPWDPQSERVYDEKGIWHSLNANESGGKSRDAVMAFSQNGSGEITEHPVCHAMTANQNPSGRGTAMIYGFQPQAGGNTGCAIMEECGPCLSVTQQAAVYDARGNGDGETVPTITGDHENRVTDYTAVCIGSKDGSIAGTLDASYYKGTGARNGEERTVVAVDCRNGTENENINGTLQAKGNGGTSLNLNNVIRSKMIVRRLTPLECERLQGMPDRWTDLGDWTDSKGKKRKAADSPRYKALGNGIALPFWYWLLKRINAYCSEHTMGSLFNGIGSFPLIWESLNGEKSCRWVSEIEEFPIAVTKKHFGDEETGERGDLYEIQSRRFGHRVQPA